MMAHFDRSVGSNETDTINHLISYILVFKIEYLLETFMNAIIGKKKKHSDLSY